MKKRILKIVTAWALVLCMTIPSMMSVQAEADVVGEAIQKDTFMVQHHSVIDSYRGTNFIAPESPDANYLFAGWYQDEDCKTALKTTDKVGAAYAKFVHKDVLGVKAQLISGTNFNTDVADIRFVSTVDTLNYQEIGFDFVIYGQNIPYKSNEVYHTLYAINDAGVVLEEYTPDLFHESSKYFFACIVQDVDNTKFDCEIQATPYWITLDGTKVSATSVTKSISDGYMPKAMDANAVLESEISSDDYTLQGGTVRSKYYYLVSSNTEGTKISRLTRNTDLTAWNTTADVESTLSVSNVKDIAYNMTEKLLVMVSGADSERTITLVDRNALTKTSSTNITTTAVSLAIESIEHNKNHDKYVVMLGDGSLKILNADFTETTVAATVPEALTGYTAQSATADDSYLYEAFSKNESGTISNVIAVYDWDGNYVTTIETTLADCEITNIDIVNNTVYAACATESGIKIYNIDILRTFDITYNLAGGTTTNPTGYTVNSEDITLTEPTREGYEFLGWSEQSLSLSEVEWQDGFIGTDNGSTPTTAASGWENAIYSEPILLKGGMKHTLTGTDIPELRWRVFADDTLTSGSTFSTKYVSLSGDRYAVLVLKEKLSETKMDSLTIHSEDITGPAITYDGGEIDLDTWTKGFLEEKTKWTITQNKSGFANAMYSNEIELTANVKYTLRGFNSTSCRARWRIIPADTAANVGNGSTNGTYTPTKDCTVRILLLDGYPEGETVTIASGSVGDRSYTANWVRTGFMVQYDANGGKGVMEDSIYATIAGGESKKNAFTKEGYVFTGWNTKADGSGISYEDGATIDGTKEESVTLYAQWDEAYSITYAYGKGATVATANPEGYTNATETFTLNRPARPGYTFKGWKETIYVKPWYNGFLDSNGNLDEDSTYTDSVYSERIYLQGDEAQTKVYTLNVPGLADKSTIRARAYYDSGAVGNLLSGGFQHKPVDNAYVSYMFFKGYEGASLDNVTVTRNTSTEIVENMDITIVQGSTGDRHYEAVWEGNSYTVQYNGNGGEGSMDSTSHVYGKEKALSSNAFTYEGYVFTGWNTEADGTGDDYENGASVKNLTTEAGGTVTLYAQWLKEEAYVITYDLGGGSLATDASNPESYENTTEDFTLNRPTRTGYTFKGWKETIYVDNWYDGYLDSEGNLDEDSTYTSSVYSGRIYLQGDNEKTKIYTLQVPGLLDKSTIRARMYYDTGSVDNLLTGGFEHKPVANGYVSYMFYLGHEGLDLNDVSVVRNTKTEAAANEAASIDITILKGSTGDRHYEALWEGNNYTVQYDANGGEGSMDSTTHVYGKAKALSPNTFTYEGYGFIGWNTEADGTGDRYVDEASVKNLTTEAGGTVTLYAQWIKEEFYEITYDLGGGSLATDESNPESYANTAEDFMLNRPTRTGYTFKGWKETIYVDNWYNGFLDSAGNLDTDSTYTDSVYSERIYLQGDSDKTKIYTLHVPGLADTDKGTIRARMYYDTGTVANVLSGGFKHEPVANGYVSYMFYLGSFDADMENITVTRDTSVEVKNNENASMDITVLKGSTGRRHYEAVWEGISYTVQYDGNGATGSMDSTSHVYGKGKALSSNIYTYDGYAFTGWNTEKDGTGDTYANGVSVKDLTTEAGGTVTLYAQWTNQDVYTITYDLGGGSLATGKSNPESYAKATESFTLKTPTKLGYVFKGWKETIYVDNWYNGFLDSAGNLDTDSTYTDSVYSERIYLQGDADKTKIYTLHVPGLADTDKGTIRARMYYDTGTVSNLLSGNFKHEPVANGYVSYLFYKGSYDADMENITVTRDTSVEVAANENASMDITVLKGSTGRRHYEAIWEDEVLPNRVVLLSDIHYTTENQNEDTAPLTAGLVFGYTQAQRVQFALEDVKAFKEEKSGLDAVMILGDLSTDDCGVRNLSTNYVKKFKTDFMDQLSLLSVNSYALAGNHDCYTNAEWKSMFGYERQYAVEVAGAKFIMLDTYKDGAAPDTSGSVYTGFDQDTYDFLKEELEKDFSGPIFVCSHYFRIPFSDDAMGTAIYDLIKAHPNVNAMFHGHTHANSAIYSGNIGGRYLVNTGGYAYDPSTNADGTNNFEKYDDAYAWGYQVLEWSDNLVRLYHVKPARTYTDAEGTHTIKKDLIEDKIVFKLKK